VFINRYFYKFGHKLKNGKYIWGEEGFFTSAPFPGEESLQRVIIYGDMGKVLLLTKESGTCNSELHNHLSFVSLTMSSSSFVGSHVQAQSRLLSVFVCWEYTKKVDMCLTKSMADELWLLGWICLKG
jgi:hypothetical protein